MKLKIASLLILVSVFIVKVYGQNYSKEFYLDNVLYVKFKEEAASHIVARTVAKKNGSWRKIHKGSAEKLKRYREDAVQKFGFRIYDLNMDFHFYLDNPDEIKNVKEELESDPLVEYVLYVPRLFDSVIPDYSTSQRYLFSPSVSGINAEAVWLTYDNRGAGVKLCDIEFSFDVNHADLPPVTILGQFFPSEISDHGTAVLGEVVSLNNGVGTTGIASECDAYFASIYIDEENYDLAATIINTLETLSAGDVLLLEQHIPGPNSGPGLPSQFGFVPVEWYKPYYDAIRLAVAQGIIVIEAAGNGQQNLDDPIYSLDDDNYGNVGHYPFLPGNGSGAILVGGGAVDPLYGGRDVARSRLFYSNYGSSVHLQGHGEAVYTTGYGHLYSEQGMHYTYTDRFSGTSSASPVVAGAAILLQSVCKQITGRYLSSNEVKKLLINTGQPQQAGTYPATQHIGPLPDVYAAIQNALVVLGAEQNQDLMISVYPNPTNGNFKIASVDKQNASLRILNSMGQDVYSSSLVFTEDAVSIDLSNQPKGIYFMEYRNASSLVTKKIVVH